MADRTAEEGGEEAAQEKTEVDGVEICPTFPPSPPAHTGAGPGQCHALAIHWIVAALKKRGRLADITWIGGHAGTPGSEKEDTLGGNAAEKVETRVPIASLAYLKLRISERYKTSKEEWHTNPARHGTEEIAPPLPK